MRLSRKADYALRVLFSLVEHQGRGPVSMSELARGNEVPKKFLEHIMLDLKRQGWVASTPGRSGGYVLACSPASITMGQVVRVFDGAVAPIGCVSATRFEACGQAPRCRFRRAMLEIRDLTLRYLDNLTIERTAGNEPVGDHEVFALHLLGGDGI